MKRSDTSEGFDRYAANYEAVVQSSIEFSGLEHSFFLEAKADLLRAVVTRHFGSSSKPAALDVGCGTGSLHRYIRSIFLTLDGVDVSAASVRIAAELNPDVRYVHYDGRTLPHGDAAFDLASAVCVMHHVPPDQWAAFIREMKRVVRPGGLICIIEHNPLNLLTRLGVHRCPFDADAVLLRSGTTEGLLRDLGLRNISTHFFLLVPSAAPVARRVERWAGRLPLGAQYLICGIV